MAGSTLSTDEVTDSTDPKAADNTPGVQTPNIKESGGKLVIERKAIRDAEQANEIGLGLEQGNKERNDTNAIIVAQYDGEQPFAESDLVAAGEDWRNNFPTGFMAGIIDRVTPAPVSLIDSTRYLTSSRLDPKKFKDSDRKSKLFQSVFTKTVRGWQGWRPFCYSLCQEEVLIGYAAACWTDEYNWRPRLYRSNEAFVPEGTEQHASTVQSLSLKQSFLIHELVDIIADMEAAKAAGWDIDNTCFAINHALPKVKASDKSETQEDQRSYEDTIREGNRGSSYQNGAKVINVRHVFVVEPSVTEEDGKVYQRVTHYIIDRDSRKELFSKEDRFERMSDVIALFTLQPGNGKYYGSKGLGKILVNLHIAIERARNIAFDQLYMAGMLIIHDKDGKGNPTIQLKVRHPFALISTTGEISQEQIQANVEAFLDLDNKLTSIAEQAANAYIPNKLSGLDQNRDRTATEASIDAQRDQQAKVAYLARFWGQFADLINSMQRKLADPETIDEEAKAFQAELLEAGLTPEEIKALADAPAAEVQDLSDMNDQKMIAAAQALNGNPRIDQEKLLRRFVTALTSPIIADDLILPDGIDPTVESENFRQQMIENEMFMLGTSMNVSPRDNHEVHLKTGLSQLQEAAPKMAKLAVNAPEVLDHIGAALIHFHAHVFEWQKAGATDEQLQPYLESIQKAEQLLEQLAQYVAKMKAGQVTDAVMQAQQQGASGAPAGVVPGETADPQQQQQQVDPAMRNEAIKQIVDSMQFDKLPFEVQNSILRIVGLPTMTQPQISSGQSVATPGQPMPTPGATMPPKIAPVAPIDPNAIAMQMIQRHQPTPVAAPATGLALAAKLSGTGGQPRTAASARAETDTALPQSPLPA
jgi:hypothetical protein